MNRHSKRFAALALILLLLAAMYGPAEARSKKKKTATPRVRATATVTPTASPTPVPTAEAGVTVEEDGEYTDKEHVAAYLRRYGRLPSNYITKNEAQRLGWSGNGRDSLWKYAPGKMSCLSAAEHAARNSASDGLASVYHPDQIGSAGLWCNCLQVFAALPC